MNLTDGIEKLFEFHINHILSPNKPHAAVSYTFTHHAKLYISFEISINPRTNVLIIIIITIYYDLQDEIIIYTG